MTSGGTRYTVVLDGFDLDCLQLDPRAPAERVAEAFGIAMPAAEKLVGTLPAVVKRHATEDVAQHYADALRKIGGSVELRFETGSLSSARALATTSSAAMLRAATRVDCPRCGFSQPVDDECIRCGADLPDAPEPEPDSLDQAQTILLGSHVDLNELAGEAEDFTKDLDDKLPTLAVDESISLDLAASSAATELTEVDDDPISDFSDFFATVEAKSLDADSPPLVFQDRHDESADLSTPNDLAAAIADVPDGVGTVPEDLLSSSSVAIPVLDAKLGIAPTSLDTSSENDVQAVGNDALELDDDALDLGPDVLPSPAELIPRQRLDRAATAPGSSTVPPSGSGFIAGHHTRPERTHESRPSSSFWTSIPLALIAPLRGSGFFWLPVLAIVLSMTSLGSCAGSCFGGIIAIVFTFIYIGAQSTYFARSIECGLEGEAVAPPFRFSTDITDIKDNYLYPGVALTMLAGLLFVMPFFVLWTSGTFDFGGEEYEDAVAPYQDPDLLPEGVVSVDPLVTPTVFYDEDGVMVTVTDATPSRFLYTHNDELIYVEPIFRRVTTINEFYEDDFEPLPPPPLKQQSSGVLTVLLALLLVVLPFYYWPMALTVAGLSNSLLNTFNPVLVLGAAIRGGLPYLFIAALGITLPLVVGGGLIVFGALASGAGFAASLATWAISSMMWAYISGVQGHLVGRLIATRPQAYEGLNR